MAYKIDFEDGDVRIWAVTDSGARFERVTDYHPTFHVAGGTADERAALELHLSADSRVVDVGVERWHLDLRSTERSPVLRVDVATIDDVRAVAHEARSVGDPGQFRCYDVDFSPQFRYCLEEGVDPTPNGDLSILRLDLPEAALHDGDVSAIEVGGEPAGASDRAALEAVAERVRAVDPDVLVVSHGDVVPLLFERAKQLDIADFRLGRLPGYEQLADENTFHNDGRVGHSPARYDVPGRAILDAGHSFFWNQTSIGGLLDLVEFSHKPLQEVGWASIGNVLSAVEIREARDRGVLAPWNKWEPESFKAVETLHEADRGGYIFEPDVGVHESVHEVDFSSLYPNVIRHRNVSPETVDCECCPDRADVPGLDYGICEQRGFLPDVLAPLLDQRQNLKDAIRDADGGDDERARELRSRANALKWILVACFGYQGYRNSKFGRIECHEAINAYARAILLTAKEAFEAAGWRVVHGIVDSLWLTPVREHPDPIRKVCEALGEEIEVPLEFENRYDWLALVPKRGQESGALTKYFGKVAGEDEFKVRGIECRQRSTPPFVADTQRDLLETLDARRDPGAVCDTLERRVADLRAGGVDPTDLVIEKRVSKRLEEYSHETRTVAALRRARDLGVEYLPGEKVRYVVTDDGGRAADRVRLAFEEPTRYDADFYADQLARAAVSVVSPLGWNRSDVDAYLDRGEDVGLGAFVSE